MARKHTNLIEPYGGQLIQAYATQKWRSDVSGTSTKLPRIDISSDELLDLQMLACGSYSPLDGFMDQETYYSVCKKGKLPSGLSWGLPITLAVSEKDSLPLLPGMEARLYYQSIPVAILGIKDKYHWDKPLEIEKIFGGSHSDCFSMHPTRYDNKKTQLIGGKISLLIPHHQSPIPKKHSFPKEVRDLITQNGLSKLAAILASNPWMRTHEYLLKSIIESSGALIMHFIKNNINNDIELPKNIVNDLKKTMLQQFFPSHSAYSNVVPNNFGKFTPRSVLHTAIVSQNYGCETLFIAPELKDHWTKDDQNELETMFAKAHTGGLSIKLAYLGGAFYCETCSSIATKKTCPHDSSKRVVSGEQELIKKLYAGEHLPPQLIRPEIAQFISRGISINVPKKYIGGGRHIYPHATGVSPELRHSVSGHRGCVLWLTGLSGSGKSTIASRLEKELLLTGHRVFLLDGDHLRNGLCNDLDFSRASRRENLRRAGEISKLLSDASLIVIASFISPFRDERLMVSEIIGAGFHEVFIQASLEACEARDPKGLYRRARAGIIPNFTGITSPYEIPEKPAITVDTTTNTIDQSAHELLLAMGKIGLLCHTKMSSGYLKAAELSRNDFSNTLKGD